MSELLILNCPPRVAKDLTYELMDKLEEAHVSAQTLLYGITTKAHDGFVILQCSQSFPGDFIQRIHKDEEITDYILCQNITMEGQP